MAPLLIRWMLTEKVEIVRTIVALAWNLGMDVVAEGVETNKCIKSNLSNAILLRVIFSKPLDSKTAESLITTAFNVLAMNVG